MIKESSNLNGQEAQLEKPNQKLSSQMLNLPVVVISMQKNLRYRLILSRDINDQRSLQSDWKREKTGHIRPKMVVSDVTFPW